MQTGPFKRIEGYVLWLSKQLGKGSFGAVYEGIQETTMKPVAVKVIEKSRIEGHAFLLHCLHEEITICRSLQSQHVVELIQVLESSNNYYLVQELCSGTLEQLLQQVYGQKNAHGYHQPSMNGCLEEATCIDLLTQMAFGLLGLIAQGIIHRDLKPANLLLKDGVIKIGDFGLSKRCLGQDVRMQQGSVGTPLYMSWELLQSKPYTSKCDIWAIGIIFYEMLHGHTPWQAANPKQLSKRIATEPLRIGRHGLQTAVQQFLRGSLQVYEHQRMDWYSFFSHPIFGGCFLQRMPELSARLESVMSNEQAPQLLLESNHWRGLSQLSFDIFVSLLRQVAPNITIQEAEFIFRQTDSDGNGRISRDEVTSILNRMQTGGYRALGLSDKMQNLGHLPVRVVDCFQKMTRILKKRNSSLDELFFQFCGKQRNCLDVRRYGAMLRKLDSTLPQTEINASFSLMDFDGSGSIQLDELRSAIEYISSNSTSAAAHQQHQQLLIQPQQHINIPQQHNSMINRSQFMNMAPLHHSQPSQFGQQQNLMPFNQSNYSSMRSMGSINASTGYTGMPSDQQMWMNQNRQMPQFAQQGLSLSLSAFMQGGMGSPLPQLGQSTGQQSDQSCIGQQQQTGVNMWNDVGLFLMGNAFQNQPFPQ